MVTSHKSTIHRAVVGLIVRSGIGRIEAERQWDSIYSGQYDRAVPGVTHTWKIGAYDFEFTKVFEGRDVDPLTLVASAHIEEQEAERDAVVRGWFRLARAVAVIVIVIVLIALTTTFFEDGSFGVGHFPYTISGCLPWGICNP